MRQELLLFPGPGPVPVLVTMWLLELEVRGFLRTLALAAAVSCTRGWP